MEQNEEMGNSAWVPYAGESTLAASTRIALVLYYRGEVDAISVFDPLSVSDGTPTLCAIYSDPDNLLVDKRAVSCDF